MKPNVHIRTHVHVRTFAASVIAVGVALAGSSIASADPQGGAVGAAPGPGPTDAPTMDSTPVPSDAASTACNQFSAALNYASSNYEDFAYNSAGTGNNVNYADPSVQSSNVVGRTALREAASSAMSAALTPGLPGEISAPMQSWSLRATKLLVIMGLHRGGDSLNDNANALNTDARNTQLACAAAGTPA